MEDLKQPEEVISEIENIDAAIDDIINQVQAKEKSALQNIFTRFCLLKVVAPDFNKVKPRHYPERQNFTEYYYRNGNGVMYFLMSSEFKVVDDKPVLEILPNKELAYNDEI